MHALYLFCTEAVKQTYTNRKREYMDSEKDDSLQIACLKLRNIGQEDRGYVVT